MNPFKGMRRNFEPVRNIMVVGVTLLCACAAWGLNFTPFYYGDPSPIGGVASTVLFLAVWLAGMVLLKHQNPMLIPSLIFCSLLLFTLFCELLRSWGFNFPYTFDLAGRIFLYTIYYGLGSHLETMVPGWYFVFLLVFLQEILCIKLYKQRRRIQKDALSQPLESPP